MPRPRKSLAEIELTGNPSKLSAEELAQRKLDELDAATAGPSDELAELDSLIARAMAACRRGQTVRGKRNAAFENLSTLMRLRTHCRQPKQTKKSTAQIVAEADQILGLGKI